MHPDNETYDILSLTVTAIVAIAAVTLMVLNLAPGVVSQHTTNPQENSGGRAFDYVTDCTPIAGQFDGTWLDFNGDGIIDYYDYQDVLDGKVDCTLHQCDVTNDGLIDARDQEAFNGMIRRLYDYDNDGQLTRQDLIILRQIMEGSAQCDANHICDLNGDSNLCADDLTRYTSLLYNYDFEESNLAGASFHVEITGIATRTRPLKSSNSTPK